MALSSTTTLGTRSVAEAFTTGSESAPTVNEPNRGVFLDSVARLDVILRCLNWFPSQATFTAGDELQAWWLDPTNGAWARVREYDLPFAPEQVNQTLMAWPAREVPSRGRLCYVPVGFTTTSGGVSVDYLAVGRDGSRL